MAKRSPARDDAWLVMADRYVAEAQAEWAATMTARPVRTGLRRGHQSRDVAAKLSSNHLVMADRYIAATEKRLARQAAVIGQLAAGNHETTEADDQFWVMGQLLDAMRDRRQLLADGEEQSDTAPTADTDDLRL